MEPVRFTVYSDYLCPWCFNGSVRLRRLEEEFGEAVELTWHPFLLRPRAGTARDPARFRRYTESWQRPAAESDSGSFRVWEGDAAPPTHSVPAWCTALAAARVSNEAFLRTHFRLLSAYFTENRDISDPDVLAALWDELALPAAGLDAAFSPERCAEVLTAHAEALDRGVTGVPAMQLAGNDAVVVGAQPYALYQRWVERTLARREA